MKKILQALILTLALAGLPALAQYDPANSSPTTVLATTTGASSGSPYAVLNNVSNEVVLFMVLGTGSAAGVVIEGTIESEATVKAGTATWVTLTTTSALPVLAFVESPPAYIRVRTTSVTGGNARVLARGVAGVTLRLVQ